MRVLNHDFAGHPFQIELSRSLAGRGHEVLHAYCRQLTTGVGALSPNPDDPETLSIEPVDVGREFNRYSLTRRPRDELAYGRVARRLIDRFQPDVVLSGNTPVLAQAALRWHSQQRQARFVFWLQDVLSIGTTKQLQRRAGRVGTAAAAPLRSVERRSLAGSDHVVAITEDFRPLLRDWGVVDERVTVIENWAPRDGVVPMARQNTWSTEHGLDDEVPTFLYAGTLGLKHDPESLATLAATIGEDGRVVVLTEGLGADYLTEQRAHRALDNLKLMPFQPFERMGEVLASADVLLALLETEAGVFSVPSKVLTYHCAGRPVLASMPKENLAASIIEREGSGVVTPPGDRTAFAQAGLRLLDDPSNRDRMGAAARAYADRAFDIEAISDRFERVLLG